MTSHPGPSANQSLDTCIWHPLVTFPDQAQFTTVAEVMTSVTKWVLQARMPNQVQLWWNITIHSLSIACHGMLSIIVKGIKTLHLQKRVFLHSAWMGGERWLAEHCFVTIHYSFRAVATGRPLSSAEHSVQYFFFSLSLLFEGPVRVTDAAPDNISLFATTHKKSVFKAYCCSWTEGSMQNLN